MSAQRESSPPAWLADVIERRFRLARYVTVAVWERALVEGRSSWVTPKAPHWLFGAEPPAKDEPCRVLVVTDDGEPRVVEPAMLASVYLPCRRCGGPRSSIDVGLSSCAACRRSSARPVDPVSVNAADPARRDA